MQKKVNDPNTTPIKQNLCSYQKYKSSRRSLGKAIKATDDLEIIKSEIDYNMAEQYVALLNQEQQVHLKAG